jgi:membrane-bound lytic murein transglycosylase D
MTVGEMSGPTIANLYISANLLLAAAATSLAGIRALSAALPRPLTYRHLVVIGRTLAITALLLPLLTMWRSGGDLLPLKAQVWSAPSMHTYAEAIPYAATIDLGLDSRHASLPLNAAAAATLVLFAIGLFITLLPLISEVRATAHSVRSAHVLRRIGRVRVLVSDHEHVPFAIWIPWRSFVVLPAALLLRPADLRLALRHEAQHHRRGDTRYLYAALLGRALFGLNPAAHWLARQLLELQEFACDEALARREGHRALPYCTCLLHVAEAALPAGEAVLRSFMARSSVLALARRIEAILHRPARPLRAPTAVSISLLAVALLTALSAAIAMPVQDRRLSRADAVQLEAAAQRSSAIPLEVNDAVVRQLNLLLGTPDGRAFLRSSIARMHYYEPNILAALKRTGLPTELSVVPLVESGYRNGSPRRSPGAGLWMFIPSTARHYGLDVSGDRDERLNITAETRAAMRMFSDLQRRFHDWPLTLMAYNSGAAQVEAGIHATHSRDAWTLYRAGYGNDPNYLARTVAVIVILANPRLLD